MRILLTLAASAALCGCGISADIYVEADNHPEPLKGMATATCLTGTFYAEDNGKLYCNGAYNSRDGSPSLEVNFQCSDGRSGKATVNRYGDYLQHGTGQGQLSDGTAIKVYMGDEAKQK